jgi:hypothetical protein
MTSETQMDVSFTDEMQCQRQARGLRKHALALLTLALAAVLCMPAMASAATRYMSATGTDSGSCSTSSSPCRTIGYAYNQAAAGDVVQVAAGSYGAQTVTGTKASPGVVFDLSPSAYFTDVGVNATWVEFRNGRIDDYGWWSGAIPSNVTMRNITAKTVSMNGGTNISILGGSIGGYTAPAGDPTVVFAYGWRASLTNLVFDGVDFHDISHANAGDHFEAIRMDGDVNTATIRNSTFRNITANSSLIFVSDINGGADPRNLTFENNFFSAASSAPGGGAYFAINMNAVVSTCQNYTFSYNSFAGTAASLECPTKSNVSWIGNVAPKAPGCQGNTFRNNVWQSDTSATVCDPTDKWVNGAAYSSSALGFQNGSTGDLHLTSTSPAKDAGNALTFPAMDIDCGSRMSAGTPDAGADEYGMSGACGGATPPPPPPPPPADTTAPDTTITSGPTDSTSTSASVAFTSSESGSTFECKLDAGSWAACTSPKAVSGLSVGSHTMSVRAIDAAGNVDASPATDSWTVSSVPAPPPPAFTKLIGNSVLESQVEYNPVGEAQAFRFAATGTGTMKTIKMYVDATSTATSLTVGLYSDASSHPKTLLASTKITAVAGTWNTLAVPATGVTAGKSYWFAVLGTGSGTLRYRDRANAGTSETHATESLTALPSAWRTGSQYPYAAPSIMGG